MIRNLTTFCLVIFLLYSGMTSAQVLDLGKSTAPRGAALSAAVGYAAANTDRFFGSGETDIVTATGNRHVFFNLTTDGSGRILRLVFDGERLWDTAQGDKPLLTFPFPLGVGSYYKSFSLLVQSTASPGRTSLSGRFTKNELRLGDSINVVLLLPPQDIILRSVLPAEVNPYAVVFRDASQTVTYEELMNGFGIQVDLRGITEYTISNTTTDETYARGEIAYGVIPQIAQSGAIGFITPENVILLDFSVSGAIVEPAADFNSTIDLGDNGTVAARLYSTHLNGSGLVCWTKGFLGTRLVYKVKSPTEKELVQTEYIGDKGLHELKVPPGYPDVVVVLHTDSATSLTSHFEAGAVLTGN